MEYEIFVQNAIKFGHIIPRPGKTIAIILNDVDYFSANNVVGEFDTKHMREMYKEFTRFSDDNCIICIFNRNYKESNFEDIKYYVVLEFDKFY